MTDTDGVAQDQLRSYIERVERVQGEIDDLNADKSEIFKEAKAQGFDVKAIREVIRLRKMDQGDRQEREHMLDVYKRALGMA